MPLDRLTLALDRHFLRLQKRGTTKGGEPVIRQVVRAERDRGPRYLLEGQGQRAFIRMNSNSYLGLALHPEVIRAEEATARAMGTGPGAVRFIAGTHAPHVALENSLAAFHGRDAGMIFSSAYAAVMGTLVSLIDPSTAVISDELNHNSIINAVSLGRPRIKSVYRHLDMAALDHQLAQAAGRTTRAIVVTDGIFSMRGDHAPLNEIMEIARHHDQSFPENVVVVVDDSHGVGAFGPTGRGAEEHTGGPPADILIGTLGKALAVNGGYVVSTDPVIRYLRETSPFYIYSNPITAAEASAALAALGILDSPEGQSLLDHLRDLTRRFESGLVELGCEVLPGEHPIVPLMLRDTDETRRVVRALFDGGVLATGLTYPVVPRGDEEIRLQVNADHTTADLERVLSVLAAALGQRSV